MYAVGLCQIGERIRWRRVQEGWSLAEDEQFTVEYLPENPVLSEDGMSVRPMTEAELQEEERQGEIGEIRTELKRLDNRYNMDRSVREFIINNPDQFPAEAVDRMKQAEREAQALRDKLNK